jgi:hypothetical protein
VPATRFGNTLDLDGELLVVGDPWMDNGRRAVHAFERDPQIGAWTFEQSLHGGEVAIDQQLGAAIAVQGNRVLAGAPGYGPGYGNAILWERDPVSHVRQVGLQYTNVFGTWQGYAGRSVALDGDAAYIAMSGGSWAHGIRHYRYDPIGTNWMSQGPILRPASPVGTYSHSVAGRGLGAIAGGFVFVAGDAQNSNPVGHRLFFMGDSHQDCAGNGISDVCEIGNGTGIDLDGNGLLDVCEGIGSAYCQSTAVNSVGILGQLSADGSQLVQENSVTLWNTQLPPNQCGYAVNSPYQGVVLNPGGSQGNLRIFGPSLGRHNRPGEVCYSGATGEFDVIIALTSFPSPLGPNKVQAGETWNFQVWYRDQNPSSTSHMTNAVSLTFQ